MSFKDIQDETAWCALVQAALAGLGNASQAIKQADHVHGEWRKGRGERSEVWLAFAAGALAYHGVGTQAIVQANTALEELERRRELRPMPELKPEDFKVLQPRKLERTATLEVASESPLVLKLGEHGGGTTYTGPILPGKDVVEVVVPPPTPPVEPEPVVVEPAGIVVPPPAPAFDAVWMAGLSGIMPTGEAADAAFDALLARWALAENCASDGEAQTHLEEVLAPLGTGKKWDPRKPARTIVAFAGELSALRQDREDYNPSLQELENLTGVNRRVLDGYRMVGLGERPEKRPDDTRLARWWDVLSQADAGVVDDVKAAG